MEPETQPTPDPATPPTNQPVVAPSPTPTPPATPPSPSVVAPPPTATAPPSSIPTSAHGRPSALRMIVGGIFSWLIIPLGLVIVLHLFVFQAFHVVGTSMFSTLHDADYLIISKVGHTEASIEHKPYVPKRNQIIVFHYPKQPALIFVKRVIGLPGDRVVVSNGQVRVYNPQHPQGFDPNTGYEQPDTTTLIDTDVTVPPDNLFVMGDNRAPNASSDSRDWGFLPTNDIIGNAVLRLIPLNSVRTF